MCSPVQIHRAHAVLIKAWADGATIQCKNDKGEWHDIPHPSWCATALYRIKPEPKPDFVKYTNVYKNSSGYLFDCLDKLPKDTSKAGVLQLTFDGETGTLKSSQVICL